MALTAYRTEDRKTKEDEPCPGCGDGDKVPHKGYWLCPVCDTEWYDDEEGYGE